MLVEGRGVRLRVAAEVYDVTGWSLARSGLLVSLGGAHVGEEVRLGGAPARGLAQLAPSAPRVTLERVPLATLWAPVLDQMAAAVTTAVLADAAVVVAPE